MPRRNMFSLVANHSCYLHLVSQFLLAIMPNLDYSRITTYTCSSFGKSYIPNLPQNVMKRLPLISRRLPLSCHLSVNLGYRYIDPRCENDTIRASRVSCEYWIVGQSNCHHSSRSICKALMSMTATVSMRDYLHNGTCSC
jgi:hypothetical protein